MSNSELITVHHLQNSRSQRILWLLEELDVGYEVQRYERDATTNLAPPELLAVHPLGKSPVISDGEHTIAETGAIIEYLVERYGNGRLAPAADSADRLRYRYWLHYAEGSLMPFMVMSLIFGRIEQARMPFFTKPIARSIVNRVKTSYLTPNIVRNLQFLEKTLSDSTWFAGNEFSAADVQMSFPLEAAAARAGLGDNYPALSDFLERIHARPAYRRALTSGGPYDLLR